MDGEWHASGTLENVIADALALAQLAQLSFIRLAFCVARDGAELAERVVGHSAQIGLALMIVYGLLTAVTYLDVPLISVAQDTARKPTIRWTSASTVGLKAFQLSLRLVEFRCAVDSCILLPLAGEQTTDLDRRHVFSFRAILTEPFFPIQLQAGYCGLAKAHRLARWNLTVFEVFCRLEFCDLSINRYKIIVWDRLRCAVLLFTLHQGHD